MATPEFISYFLNTANNLTGSMWLIGFAIVAFFVIAFMLGGIDFKWAIIFCIPLLLGVSGYLLPVWVSGIIWLVAIMIGGYMAWNYIFERI